MLIYYSEDNIEFFFLGTISDEEKIEDELDAVRYIKELTLFKERIDCGFYYFVEQGADENDKWFNILYKVTVTENSVSAVNNFCL